MDLRVTDPLGNELAPGETGEIWFRGPMLIRGYWNRPDATADTIVDGWLRSGDIGRVDDEGFVYVSDRAKDMVLRGGENIYSAEVEAAIYEHPAVYEAAVYGLPHERLGEELACHVMVKPGETLEVAELAGVRRRTTRQFQGADPGDHRDRTAPPQRLRQDPQARTPRRHHRPAVTIRGGGARPRRLLSRPIGGS